MEKIYRQFLESSGISTDTRTLIKDEMFFCLKGENFNGNKFAQAALEKGAKYVIIDDKDYWINERTILVENALLCLQNLANHHRKQFDIPIIGITGSNGKTTTKELISHLLSQQYNVLATKGNLNNHIGVPLTLLQLNHTHEIAIIEMGANHPGDIQELCNIAQPNYGIITNIGKAHLEGFKNIEGVIETKTALYRSVAINKGTLFINADDTILTKNKPEEVKIEYYSGQEKDATIINGQLIQLTPLINLSWTDKSQYQSPELHTKIIGEYNFYNLIAAIAISKYFQVSNDNINQGIETYSNENNRSQLKETDRNQLIMDAYNANPSSVNSAINSFIKVSHSKKIMILGDMFELGEESPDEHRNIITLAIQSGIQTFFIGERYYAQKIESSLIDFYRTKEEMIQQIETNPLQDSLILLKGSRGMALETLVEYL